MYSGAYTYETEHILLLISQLTDNKVLQEEVFGVVDLSLENLFSQRNIFFIFYILFMRIICTLYMYKRTNDAHK